jgi:hypothetical protein
MAERRSTRSTKGQVPDRLDAAPVETSTRKRRTDSTAVEHDEDTENNVSAKSTRKSVARVTSRKSITIVENDLDQRPETPQKPVLPSKIVEGEPLPTLAESQAAGLPASQWQTVAERYGTLSACIFYFRVANDP